MFLSDLSIKQPVLATMMMVALAVLGLTSYQALKVDLFPDVEFPVVTVTTRYTGASPETVERDVTKFIEEAANTVEGVRHIESTSQEGLSTIVVQFNVGVPTLNASQDIRGKVAAIRGELPREIDEPIILRIDPASTPIVSVAVNAPAMTPRAVSDIADKIVKRRLENVQGVGAVNLVGEAKREIQVVVDRTRLESYSLSLAEVVDALRTQNVDAPVGTADRGATEAMVRVSAQGTSAAQIADIPVKRVGERTILVRDIAQVIDGVEEATSVAFVNNRPAIALDVQKQAGANTVGVADGVREAVARMQPELPPGVSLQMVRDDSAFIRESIEDVQVTLVLGGLLTVFIVFLFLNSWRSTVITGLTLPISVVAAFIAMRMFGFTLNVLTLMGLSLAIGMLIDDAIVVRENIVRHMQKGKSHLDAAREGTAEIGLAVMATTFTIIAVFIPVAFMGGMVGQFFYEFGITVAAAVLVSLFVSFTLDPMLSSRWYDPDVEEDRQRGFVGRLLQAFNRRFDALHGSYERTLSWSLRHRWVVSIVALVAFIGAFPILAVLGGDFMPDYNRGEYQVAFKATPGATLRETSERVAGDGREAAGAARRRVHLHHDRRSRFAIPARHRRCDLREAEAAFGRHVQRSPRSGAPEGRAGRGAHVRTDRGRRLRPEADSDQRPRSGDRRSRPDLPGARRGDARYSGHRRHREQSREIEAGAPRQRQPSAGERSRYSRLDHRRDDAGGRRRPGRDDDSGLDWRQP